MTRILTVILCISCISVYSLFDVEIHKTYELAYMQNEKRNRTVLLNDIQKLNSDGKKKLLQSNIASYGGPSENSETTVMAKERYESATSIDLARNFMDRLQVQQPITYEEECFYFGELTLYSAILLSQFGYIDESGKWLRDKPEYSLLCELIRLHASDYFLHGKKTEYFFASIPKIKINKELEDGIFNAFIAYVQERSDYSYLQASKTIIITYRIPQKKLDFPILIDGESLASQLGFSLNKDKRIVLNENAFSILKKHLMKISN